MIGFEHQSDAIACLNELQERFATFGLKLNDQIIQTLLGELSIALAGTATGSAYKHALTNFLTY